MKKFIMTALAASLTLSPLAVTAAQAAPQHRQTTTVKYKNNGRRVVKTRTVVRQPADHAWRTGERFDRRYAANYRSIPNWRTYRLNTPARGAHWYRSGRDAVLVRANGTVISVRHRVF